MTRVAPTNTMTADCRCLPLERPLRRLVVTLLALLLMSAQATCRAQGQALPLLRFIAPTNNAMPIAGFEADVLVKGVVKDLSELLAARLGRRAVFKGLPSRRVSAALAAGEADAICFVLPEWLSGDFNWTRGLIPDASLVAATLDAPDLRDLHDLAGQPLGTVLGYAYPTLQAALGDKLKRADVTNMTTNLRRLAAGRVRYALVEKTALDYFLKHRPEAPVRIAWVVERFEARCAFSKSAVLPFAEVKQAVDRMVADGSVERLLARYR